MIEHWLSYGLADFVPFTPATYLRLFELTNEATWPLPLATWAAGLAAAVLALGRRDWQVRAVLLLLAAAWAWVSWAYHLDRHAAINPAAPWYAAAFALQAVVLAALAARGGVTFSAAGPGVFIAAAGLALWPLLRPVDWQAVEVFGTAPDPTAVVTLGLLLMAAGRARWLWITLPVPLLWCLASGLTLLALELPAAVPTLVLPVAGTIIWARRRSNGLDGAR